MVDDAMIKFIKQSMINVGLQEEEDTGKSKESPRLKRAFTIDDNQLLKNSNSLR